MNIKEILEDPRLNISPTAPAEQMVSQFGSYLDLLVKWNQKINLTSEKSSQDILLRHIFDSLQYAPVISPKDEIVDIGSGAGFPGIPLKIIYPELVATLIESQRKRCSFLETVIFELGLKGTKVINDRAEKISPERLAEAVIFRGVSNIQSCLELAIPFLGREGKVVLIRTACSFAIPPFKLSGKLSGSPSLKSGFFSNEKTRDCSFISISLYSSCSNTKFKSSNEFL